VRCALRARSGKLGEVRIGRIPLRALARGEPVALGRVGASELRAGLRQSRGPDGGQDSGGGAGGVMPTEFTYKIDADGS
jgi:hypothetical protein